MSADAALLAEVPLFQLLDLDERVELASHLEIVKFPVGHIIFNYGEPGDAMYIIRSGEAELSFQNDTGEKIVLEMATRGDFFGELAFLDGGSRSATVRVTAELEAFEMDREELGGYLKKHPEAAVDLLASLGKRLRKTSETLRHTATRNVNEETEDKRTVVQKSADWIAEFSGSIPFLVLHAVFFGTWIGWNTLAPANIRFDSYPFNFLTMCVSLEAIFLSVFVLLSQNRQTAKDRVRADIEYDVNLRAELEIAHLHKKIDQLNSDVLAKLSALGATPARPSGGEHDDHDVTGCLECGNHKVMKTVHAIFENGVFRPLDEVDLPNESRVEFEPRRTAYESDGADQTEIYALLSMRFHSGESDVAARHDEHQP